MEEKILEMKKRRGALGRVFSPEERRDLVREEFPKLKEQMAKDFAAGFQPVQVWMKYYGGDGEMALGWGRYNPHERDNPNAKAYALLTKLEVKAGLRKPGELRVQRIRITAPEKNLPPAKLDGHELSSAEQLAIKAAVFALLATRLFKSGRKFGEEAPLMERFCGYYRAKKESMTIPLKQALNLLVLVTQASPSTYRGKLEKSGRGLWEWIPEARCVKVPAKKPVAVPGKVQEPDIFPVLAKLLDTLQAIQRVLVQQAGTLSKFSAWMEGDAKRSENEK